MISAGHCWVPALACLAGLNLAQAASSERSCAIFDSGGHWDSAVASSGRLIFQMPASDARPKGIEMGLEVEPLSCRLFLSADQRYAAVGVYLSGRNEDALQIGVIDRPARKWTSRFVIRRRDDLWGKLRLDGFLGDTSKVVVSGIGKSGPREDVKLKVLLSGPEGKAAADAGDRTLPRSNPSWDADSVDARHNRLWFVGSPQFCPVKSVSLAGAAIPETRTGYGASMSMPALARNSRSLSPNLPV